MNKINLKNKLTKLLFAFILMLPVAVFSQTCTDPSDPTSCDGGDVDSPIDTYAIYLAIIVLLIGVFMIVRARKNALNNA